SVVQPAIEREPTTSGLPRRHRSPTTIATPSDELPEEGMRLVATEASIRAILIEHARWLENPEEGQQADLSGMTLNESNFERVNLRSVIAVGTTLLDAHMVEAILTAATLTRADFQRANLAGADLAKADVTGADFGGGWLAGANLCEIAAHETSFRKAKLSGAR